MSVGAAMEGFRASRGDPVHRLHVERGSTRSPPNARARIGTVGASRSIVLRGPAGRHGPRRSSFHSLNPEPYFAYSGGIKVCPALATPYDAKGLIKSAIRDDDPVVFLEHKWIYRGYGNWYRGPRCPPGKASRLHREGGDVSIVTCGAMVHRPLEAADALAEAGVSVEIVDLRTSVRWMRKRSSLDREDLARAHPDGVLPLRRGSAPRWRRRSPRRHSSISTRPSSVVPPNVPVPFSHAQDAFLPGVDDIVRRCRSSRPGEETSMTTVQMPPARRDDRRGNGP